jgi:hypothetical protein
MLQNKILEMVNEMQQLEEQVRKDKIEMNNSFENVSKEI